MKYNLKRKKGSVFILSIIFTFIVGSAISSLLVYQIQYHKINALQVDRTYALYQAESGDHIVRHQIKYRTQSNRFDSSEGWSTTGVPDGYTHKWTDSDNDVYYMNIQFST